MAGEGEQPTGPSGDNSLRKLYDSLGGGVPESTFADNPDFRQGFEDYHLLLKHRENIGPLGGHNPKKHWPDNDLHSGEHYTKGLRVTDKPIDMKVSADTPEEYARQVDDFYSKLREYVEGGKPLTLAHNIEHVRPGHTEVYDTKFWSPKDRRVASTKELDGIRKHMIGFGKAALDEGDIKVALLSFDAVGALDDSQVAKAVEEVVRDGGKDLKEEFRKTMQTVEERKVQRQQSSSQTAVSK